MARKKQKAATTKPLPWNGDHGTGTAAAMANTDLIPLDGANPNCFARRQRRNQIISLRASLSQRQFQAAQEIEKAYCRVQTCSSGGPLKAKVDSSPKPDATVAMHTDAQSRLVFVMAPVPRVMRDVVEHICWHNLPLSDLAKGRAHYNRLADLKVALDLVANRLRY